MLHLKNPIVYLYLINTFQMKYIVFILLFAQTINAQIEDSHDHSDDEHYHDHVEKPNELGIAFAPVYFLNEEEFAFGLHIHYIHTIGESKFGIGAGYEKIFDDHGHNTIGVVFSYRPLDPLSFNFAPGLTFESSPGPMEEQETNFAFHLESTYEFEVGGLHIGPALEFAYDPEDIHISLGLHVGFAF
jgi:hypothetical protein